MNDQLRQALDGFEAAYAVLAEQASRCKQAYSVGVDAGTLAEMLARVAALTRTAGEFQLAVLGLTREELQVETSSN
jgi:hypothetical protein